MKNSKQTNQPTQKPTQKKPHKIKIPQKPDTLIPWQKWVAEEKNKIIKIPISYSNKQEQCPLPVHHTSALQ